MKRHLDMKVAAACFALLAGNLQAGLWKKAFGLPKPNDLVNVVESVLDDRG